MKFMTIAAATAVLCSADAKKNKEEDVEIVDESSEKDAFANHPTYYPTYAPTPSPDEDEVSIYNVYTDTSSTCTMLSTFVL